jgi:hypothetical protein
MSTPNDSTNREPRRAVAVVGTLMPHLAAERHHIYRNATALALLAALLAAAFGSLPIALVLAAVALPAVVLTYIHDHHLWRDEPITVIGVTFALSLALGVGVGFVHTYFTPGLTVSAGSYGLPPVSHIVQLGLVVPTVAFVALLVAPLLVTTREAFRHPLDVVVTSALSGAALSLGLSVVVQHGAFTHLQATAGEPTRVAFIALTLGFLQPVILATAAAVAVLGLRSAGVNPAAGVIEGLLLLVVYELAVTLLAPFGSRGLVLTALAAFALAGAGLLVTRAALHTAVDAAPEIDGVEHRLHGAVVAAVIGVVVILAAGVAAAVVFHGPSTPPKPPHPSGLVPTTHQAAAVHPSSVFGGVVLASTTTPLADGVTVNFLGGVTLAVAPGWTISKSWNTGVWVQNSDNSAQMEITVGHAHAPDINGELAWHINDEINLGGLTNVVQAPSDDGVKAVQGKNFTQELFTGFSATHQTDQGTHQICGVWLVLFNVSTQQNAFFDLRAANTDALATAESAAKSMIASVL